MAITRRKVIAGATPATAEILVVFDVDGVTRNVTVTSAPLAAQLAAATPLTLAGIQATIYTAAEALLTA